MGLLISTDDVPARERYEYWQYVHQEHFAVDYRFTSSSWEHLQARCQMSDLGASRAAVISSPKAPCVGEGTVHRTAKLIRQREVDAYELKLFISGDSCVVAQDGRQAELRLGDFALIDLTRPSYLAGNGRSAWRGLSLVVPRTMLSLPPHQVAQVTGLRISGRTGCGELVSSLLQRMADEIDLYNPSEAARISTAVLDLVAAALAGHLDLRSTLPPEAEQHALLRRIYAFIEEHLGDPGLSPGMIAAAHHVSIRHLHKLFQTQECTVTEWIRRRRLDRCRRDLTDPGRLDRSVAAIAARWGFAGPAQFNRLFRATHGLPPGEYRRIHLNGNGCIPGSQAVRSAPTT